MCYPRYEKSYNVIIIPKKYNEYCCYILKFIIPSDADIAVQSGSESSDADIVDTDRSATDPAREVANARFAPLASSRKVKRIKNVLVKSRYSQDS